VCGPSRNQMKRSVGRGAKSGGWPCGSPRIMPKTHAGARWSISDGQLPLPQLKLSSKVQL
jgi:hypothetical protein